MTRKTAHVDSVTCSTALGGSAGYVVITPVRDEALYVQRTIDSMAQQTLLPKQWVIVDDGSTDGTREILGNLNDAGWVSVIHSQNRGYRAAGSGVVEAFAAGYATVADLDWDFIVKLDGDLSFAPDYFERCLEEFRADLKLGIGGGTVCRDESGHLVVDSVDDPPFHVRGATKIYRRSCWTGIEPLVKAPGWDTIDEVKANLHGWTTRTFADIRLVQHKPTGSAAGSWRNWFKNGRANYVAGYHPLFMLGKCVKRAAHRPYLVQSLALLAGFVSGYLIGLPQVADQDAIRFLRREQMRRLLLRPSIYG